MAGLLDEPSPAGLLGRMAYDYLVPDYFKPMDDAEFRRRALMMQRARGGDKVPQMQPDVGEGAAKAVIDFMPGGGAGPLAIFAGPAARTANKAAREIAEAMAKKGATPREIWDATGWFQGADKKWRFEIPDDTLFVGKGYGTDLMTGKIAHENLSAAYPRLDDFGGFAHDIKVARGAEPRATYYVEPDRDLEFYYGHKEFLPSIVVEAPTRKSARSVTAHELQHHVQGVENFTGGANPDMYRNTIARSKGAAPTWDEIYDAYHRTIGEVEARNVQKRLDMTPEQRRAIPPWETQDVPYELQLVPPSGGIWGARY